MTISSFRNQTSKKLTTLVLILSNILFTTGIFLYSPQEVFAVSSGPNSPGTVVDDATVGTVAWTNPDNAKTSNDTYATLYLDDGISHYLKATDLGFSIPIGSTIDGITVEIERKKSGIGFVVDEEIKIIKSNGTIGSTNKADTVNNLPTSDTYKSYGSSSDLWGEAWTYSDINDTDFGVVLSASQQGSFAANLFVDHISITVYYTGPNSFTVMSDTMSNQTASGYSTHLIKFRTPSAIDAPLDPPRAPKIVITFPSDFNFTNIVIGEIVMKDGPSTGLEYTETLASSPSTTEWGAVFSGTENRILTLTAPTDGVGAHDIVVNDYVTIAYASTHAQNASTSGSKDINISTFYGNNLIDSGDFSIPIITNSQVVLDATVAPFITFSNDNSTLHFGTLSYTAAQYADTTSDGSDTEVAGNTFTVNTNANSGYSLAYAPAATLTSGGNTIDAATLILETPSDRIGTEMYAMSAVYANPSGGGTLQVPYRKSIDNWQFLTTGATVVSTTGPVASDSIAMYYAANISNVTPAGLYTQANTWLVTGNF